MTNPSDEKRRFSRIEFDCAAEISSDQNHWSTKLLDVSLKGALVERPAEWHAKHGDEFTLTLKLNNSDISINMEVVAVAHLQDNRIGFDCKHIDIDSISHLRRLVELNLGDPALMDRELSALGNS